MGKGGTDCGGITVTGPRDAYETEYIYTKDIHLDSGSLSIKFGTSEPNWAVEEAINSACTGQTPAPAPNSPRASTHCEGAYNVVLEGTAGTCIIDVTRIGIENNTTNCGTQGNSAGTCSVIFGEQDPSPTSYDEFKIAAACDQNSCSFTVPEFSAPVVFVSAVSILLFAVFWKLNLPKRP